MFLQMFFICNLVVDERFFQGYLRMLQEGMVELVCNEINGYNYFFLFCICFFCLFVQ